MRIVLLCLVVLGGLSQLAPAATISAVLHPTPGRNTTGIATLNSDVQYFGAIAGTGVPPINGGVINIIPEASVTMDSNTTAHVKADARRVDPDGTQNVQVYLTTYSYLKFADSNAITIGANYEVENIGYWEFQVVGNYGWSIAAQAPQHTGARRFYIFQKVGGASPLASDADGNAATSASGTLGTGTYRLYYNHVQEYLLGGSLVNPTLNPNGSTNLDIFFTFQSEDPSGVVPEPASLAVFGLLGIGGAVAKWRRRK